MAFLRAPHDSTFADIVWDGGVWGVMVAFERGRERWNWWDRIEIFLLFALGRYVLVSFEQDRMR
jgi:hypothetical protein